MPSVLPVMEGKFGSTNYYIAKIPAKELTERLTIPKNLEGWEDLTIEERYQREIDYKRVRQQIAPYLATDDDRFFGAFIVSMLNSESVEFESLGSMVRNLPNLYKSAANTFGFLTLEGDEVLVPLDGQHRLAALEFAISGKDERQRDIPGIAASIDVAKDDCTVLLIKHDKIKSRKIFNKVNRYAKATSKSENLITADDDVIAVIVRSGISGDIIPSRLINCQSNTLTLRSSEFTTLATVYEATKAFLEDLVAHRIDITNLPDIHTQQLMETNALEFWKAAAEGIDLFSQALYNPEEEGDQRRRELRGDFVLCKPIAQLAALLAVIRLRSPDNETGQKPTLAEVCKRLNTLGWSVTHPAWQSILMTGNRVVSGRTATLFASRVIAYWLGEKLSTEQEEQLKTRYSEICGGKTLKPFDQISE